MARPIEITVTSLYFFCVLLVFLSFASISYFSSCLVTLLICPGVLLWGFVRLIEKDIHRIPGLFLWFAAFLVWLVIQAAGQWFQLGDFFPHVASWHERFEGITGFITAVGFYVLTVDILSRHSHTRRIIFIQGLIVFTLMLAIYLLYMALTAFPRARFWEQNSMEWVQHLWPWVGLMIQPNFFVKLLYPGAFFALSIFFYAYRQRRDKHHTQKMGNLMFLNLCFFCILAAGILFSFSRAGILSFGLAFLFYFAFFILSHPEKEEALARFGFVLVPLVLGFIYLGVKDVFTEVQTVSGELSDAAQMRGMRMMTIQTGWQMVLDKGWFGVGLGNFQMGWLLTRQTPFDLLPPSRFNDFVWLWAETGVLGIFLFLGGLLTFGIQAIKKSIETDSYFVSYMLLASVASLLALSLHALVDPAFYMEPILWLAFVVLGIGSSCFNAPSGTRDQTIEIAEDEFPGMETARKIFFFLFLGLAAAGGVCAAVKLAAYFIAETPGDPKALKLSMRLDPFNPAYPEQLSSHFFESYHKTGNRQDIDKAIWALDEALKRDKMDHLIYSQKAQMLLAKGDIKGAQAVFGEMRAALPDYYLGELTASIFFMEASLSEMNPFQMQVYENMAVQYYKKTLELNPRLFEIYSIYPLGSERVDQKFDLFRQQGRLNPTSS